jgi:hypothetical protein
VIVILNLGTTVSPGGTWTQPESKPLVKAWQGSEKLDWVTVWFPGLRTCKLNIVNMKKKEMNLHSTKEEGNNSAFRSVNGGRGELENST